MGFYAFPEVGTTVVVSFAYGLPNKPFILQILPHGLSLPKAPKGDQLWQHSDAVQQRADAEGNWLRQTDARITNILEILCRALDLLQEMNSRIASHTHGPKPVPNNSAVFPSKAVRANMLSAMLNEVTM